MFFNTKMFLNATGFSGRVRYDLQKIWNFITCYDPKKKLTAYKIAIHSKGVFR